MREGNSDEVMKVHDLTPVFRANLRVSICVAIARGIIMQLLPAGLPGNCTRYAPALLPTPDLDAFDSSSDDPDPATITTEE